MSLRILAVLIVQVKWKKKSGNFLDVESVNLSFPMKKMYVETSREDLLPGDSKDLYGY